MEYDPHKWHDNQIHGIALRTADPDEDDWTSDLALDIDHVVAWVKSEDGVRFRVAPATLTFHDVTDLKLRIDGRVEGHRVGIALPWILCIERETLEGEAARRGRALPRVADRPGHQPGRRDHLRVIGLHARAEEAADPFR